MATIRISGGDIHTKMWSLSDWQRSTKSLFVSCPKCERTKLLAPDQLVFDHGASASFIRVLARFKCQQCGGRPEFTLRQYGAKPDPRQVALAWDSTGA